MFLEGLEIGDISLQDNFGISFKIKNAQPFDPASSPQELIQKMFRDTLHQEQYHRMLTASWFLRANAGNSSKWPATVGQLDKWWNFPMCQNY